jgi:hypothetical protein
MVFALLIRDKDKRFISKPGRQSTKRIFTNKTPMFLASSTPEPIS